MIAMDGKNRYSNINIRILVIDMIESPNECHVIPEQILTSLCDEAIPLKILTPITQHLQLARFLTIAV